MKLYIGLHALRRTRCAGKTCVTYMPVLFQKLFRSRIDFKIRMKQGVSVFLLGRLEVAASTDRRSCNRCRRILYLNEVINWYNKFCPWNINTELLIICHTILDTLFARCPRLQRHSLCFRLPYSG
jgi:hypothetical protein